VLARQIITGRVAGGEGFSGPASGFRKTKGSSSPASEDGGAGSRNSAPGSLGRAKGSCSESKDAHSSSVSSSTSIS
jgi:hypothetical protein